jgi:hypothetical protein
MALPVLFFGSRIYDTCSHCEEDNENSHCPVDALYLGPRQILHKPSHMTFLECFLLFCIVVAYQVLDIFDGRLVEGRHPVEQKGIGYSTKVRH